MSTKRCYSCGETKSVTLFSKHSGRKDGYKDECKSCSSSYMRKSRDSKAKMCIEHMGCKCEDCGITLTYENDKGNYDFHHIDPNTKISKINQLLKNKVSNQRIIEELDKCVLLCKPCHNKRHSDYKKGLRQTL